jgi:hypothetical protein
MAENQRAEQPDVAPGGARQRQRDYKRLRFVDPEEPTDKELIEHDGYLTVGDVINYSLEERERNS